MNRSAEQNSFNQLIAFEEALFRGKVDEALLEAAAKRASNLECTLQEVLQSHSIISSDRIAEILAEELGVGFDPLDDNISPLSSELFEALKSGILLRKLPNGEEAVTVISRGLRMPHLVEAVEKNPKLARNLCLTTAERFNRYLRRVGATELANSAALGLFHSRPDLSAAWRGKHKSQYALLFAGLALLATYFFPQEALHVCEILLAMMFLCWTSFRLATAFSPIAAKSEPTPKERDLPYYTIIVPLYQEKNVVKRLIAALDRLNYPIEKLDIKVVCEADDRETIEALRALSLAPRYELIMAPRAGPRTKPKALMAALPFAKGSLLVVYDAEDDPDPDQLRLVVAHYRRGPPELACVQAKLAIDNYSDNWLTINFAAEYAGLFDVFLPAMADLRLPLPLGGTSNHFRTDILRKVGGWDPFNVTEDADLGIRLARFGYVSDVVESTTYEEAPNSFRVWLGQRTRWFKGWLQTWLVHMRSPLVLLNELGVRGFIAIQLMIGGGVFAALVHPLFLVLVAYHFARGDLLSPAGGVGEAFLRAIAVTSFGSGYVCSFVIGLVGLSRRNLFGSGWRLIGIFIYWILLSYAAWRALYQLIRDPYRWEKTKHGTALGRRVGHLAKGDSISSGGQKVKAYGANRRRPRRHSASG